MSDTALYYFFSTIAQSFSTALALLATVVLFRLQAAEQAAIEASDVLITNYHGPTSRLELLSTRREGAFDRILEYFMTGAGRRDGADPQYLSARTKLEHSMVMAAAIRRNFRQSMLLTGLLVGGSVVALPFVPNVIQLSADGQAFVVLGTILIGAWCFASYWWLAKATLFAGR